MLAPLPVDRRQNLSYEEFTAEYALPNRPVILENLTADWPAQKLWTPDFFRRRYGHLRVTVSRAARKTELPVTMSLDEYVRSMHSTTEKRPFYLTSWDFTAVAPELANDFSLPRYFAEDFIAELPEEVRPRLLWLFMGPPGSGFRMHVDVGHTAAWNAQLVGRKEWILYAPDEAENVYQGRVEAFSPDLERFPRFQQAQAHAATLGPGDVIFTPSCWWHQTRILETSLSVTGNYVNHTNLALVLEYLRGQPDTVELAEQLERIAQLQPK